MPGRIKAIFLICLIAQCALRSVPSWAEETACVASSLHGQLDAPMPPSSELEATAEKIAAKLPSCETVACAQNSLASVRDQLQKVLRTTCMGRNPAALRALMIHLTINEASWISAWLIPAIQKKDFDPKTFPIEYVVANLVLLPILVNNSCVNTFEKGQVGDPPVGWRQANWAYTKKAMLSNVKILGIAGATVIAANAALDTLYRQKPDTPEHYAAKFLLLTVEQLTLGNFLSVKYIDPFLKVELPGMAKAVSETLLKGKKNPESLVTGFGMATTYVAKTADFSMLQEYMQLTQMPTERLLQLTWDDVERELRPAPPSR